MCAAGLKQTAGRKKRKTSPRCSCADGHSSRCAYAADGVPVHCNHDIESELQLLVVISLLFTHCIPLFLCRSSVVLLNRTMALRACRLDLHKHFRRIIFILLILVFPFCLLHEKKNLVVQKLLDGIYTYSPDEFTAY